LYNKRSDKMKRPYAEIAPNSDSLTLATYSKVPYSGRTLHQSTASSQSNGNTMGALPPASYRPITVNTSEDIYDTQRMYDDADDAYFERALSEDAPSRHGSRLIAYDSQPYTSEDIPAGRAPSSVVSSPVRREPSPPASPQKSQSSAVAVAVANAATSSHDKLLDFGLYIISGVLMIFTMEQILQIGMRMRPSQ
jgi:hypothetical protein